MTAPQPGGMTAGDGWRRGRSTPGKDVAGQIQGEAAEFRFGAGSLDPALVLDPADANVQYILMPLRV